jgi:hypothetical protein
VSRQPIAFFQPLIDVSSWTANVVSPLQPPIDEHMIAQSLWPLQWFAFQLCPSSCAVNDARYTALLVKRDSDKP